MEDSPSTSTARARRLPSRFGSSLSWSEARRRPSRSDADGSSGEEESADGGSEEGLEGSDSAEEYTETETGSSAEEEDDDDDSDAYEPQTEQRAESSKGTDRRGAPAPSHAQPPDEEVEVEEREFGRLIEAMQDTSQQTGALRQQWDRSIEEEMESFHQDLRGAAGFKKKRTRRSVREQALSPEVKALLRDANVLFVEGELQGAIDKLEEVIRIEPTVRAAWATLSLCFGDLGQKEKEIQCRIVGAHLTARPVELWKELGRESRDLGFIQQAIYCFQQALKADKSDVDAMWDRAILLKDVGQTKQAADAFSHLLKTHPHEPEILRQLVPLLVELAEYRRAIEVLEASKVHNMAVFPDPNILFSAQSSTTQSQRRQQQGNTFSLSELVTLADLLLLAHDPVRTITTIRQGARWLQGRGAETFWDEIEDDREFDEDRTGAIATSRDPLELGRRVEMAPAYGLDVELRLRLGKARMLVGDSAEAKRHFNVVLECDVADHDETWGEVADTYFKHRHWTEALEVFSEMTEVDFLNNVSVWEKISSCHRQLGHLDAARSSYEAVVAADPDNLDAKIRLAEVYEEQGERDHALQIVNEVVRARQVLRQAEIDPTAEGFDALDLDHAEPPSLSLFDEINHRNSTSKKKSKNKSSLTTEERHRFERQREEETALAWRRLVILEPDVFVEGWWRTDVIFDADENESDSSAAARWRATREWLDTAGKLIESFRSTRQLFPRDRLSKFRGTITQRPEMQGRKNATRAEFDLDTQATDLLSRIQDRMMDEATQQTEAVESAGEPTTFRGIEFDDWVSLFMKYAFVLTKIGDRELAYETINHVLGSNVIHTSDERKLSLHLCLMSCALYARDFPTLFDDGRFLPFTYQFHNEPLRLLSSLANSGGFYAMDSFIQPANAKFYLRKSRLTEAVASGRPHYFNRASGRWVTSSVSNKKTDGDNENERQGSASADGEAGEDRQRLEDEDAEMDGDENEEREEGEDDGEDEDERDDNAPQRGESDAPQGPPGNDQPDPATALRLGYPTKMSPVVEVYYGYLLLGANSYQSAMAYFLRALTRQPNDALICLLAGISSLSRSMNRQVDNRHHTVLQGMGLLSKYRSLRKSAHQEVEYNFGRAFHQLGLLHLAVPHYEKVLSLAASEAEAKAGASETMAVDDGDRTPHPKPNPTTEHNKSKSNNDKGFRMHREAAYNLALIYSFSGSPHLARGLYERWLCI